MPMNTPIGNSSPPAETMRTAFGAVSDFDGPHPNTRQPILPIYGESR